MIRRPPEATRPDTLFPYTTLFRSGASDATGAWDGKSAYEACEVATVLFLRKYGNALVRKAGSPAAALPMLAKVADLLPTHTRRSEESQSLQQFRSEERRVGKECVRTCSSRWSPYH